MRDDLVQPPRRAHAGRVLAKLGDPRVEVLDPLQIEWREVPAGSFKMGDELPGYDIPYTFKLARFPITNAQYSAFVAAGGYSTARFWPEAEHAVYWEADRFRGRLGPYEWGEPLDLHITTLLWVSAGTRRWLSRAG